MLDPRFIPDASGPEPANPPLPVIRWPSWMDAHYSLLSTEARFTLKTITTFAGDIVYPGDSRRWAIGFFVKTSGSGAFAVRPDGMPPGYGWVANSGSFAQWFTLFNYGPIIAAPWKIGATLDGDLVIGELLLQ